MYTHQDTIVAIATPSGTGALGIIRVSGNNAISSVNAIFSKELSTAKGYTLHYGKIMKDGDVLDEVLVSIFRAPRSFTKENIVEISCHGSVYILQEVVHLLLAQGARLARPGEFTQRAYLNGAMDLAQAEAVADLIASTSAQSHRLAMSQLRGGVSRELSQLREQLLNFTSLIELELDFGEEDVEFADRNQLLDLVGQIDRKLSALISSFRLGNAIKTGVPTVIMGKPNAGKSTLLNTLLNDNRAIVSDIPGTTRDMIEDRVVIEGVEFRLMDTAGVRETTDLIEAEGVRRTLDLAQTASLIIYLFDLQEESISQAQAYIQSLALPDSARILIVGNKLDLLDATSSNGYPSDIQPYPTLTISAQAHLYIDELRQLMIEAVRSFADTAPDQAIISNARHLHALQQAYTALEDVSRGLQEGLTGDLLSIDIRTVLHYIGEITGEISNEEVLGNIFGKFCIGK